MGDRVTPYSYPSEVEESAFLCYIQSDRNISRASRCLEEAYPDDAPLPDRSTVSRWAKAKAWDARADEVIAASFPNIRRRQTARIVSLVDQAIATYAQILAGELGHLKQADLMARVAVAKDALMLGGVGTAGSRTEIGQISPSAPVAAIEENLSPLERARRQRERLENQ